MDNATPTTIEDAMTDTDFAAEYDFWADELNDRALDAIDLVMGKF